MRAGIVGIAVVGIVAGIVAGIVVGIAGVGNSEFGIRNSELKADIAVAGIVVADIAVGIAAARKAGQCRDHPP